MENTVVFSEDDRDLLAKIAAYQEENNISFQAAVKELCEKALSENTELKWGVI